jgi:TusA-related sulfurtransferase
VTGSAADLVVDSRGRRCPLPIIDLARRIAEVPVGGVVSVVADDPAARHDVPAWCEMRGQDYLGERAAADGTPAYLVRRTS